MAVPASCAAELDACAAARRVKDLDGCLSAAQAALRKDASCGKAWAFLCWALFELKRYDEAHEQSRLALNHRDWALRDREGMASLRISCRLLAGLTQEVGNTLRDRWYQKRLHALLDNGSLIEYPFEVSAFGTRQMDGDLRRVGRDEISLVDCVPVAGLRAVFLGCD